MKNIYKVLFGLTLVIVVVGGVFFSNVNKAEAQSTLWEVAQQQVASGQQASVISAVKNLATKYNISIPEWNWNLSGKIDVRKLSRSFLKSIGLLPERAKAQVTNPTLSVQSKLALLKVGKLEGEGTHFALSNSKYLNVVLDSSVPIKLFLESVQQMVTMRIEPISNTASADFDFIPATEITLGGFLPNTTYHMYQDDYHNHTAFMTDASGKYTYTQDLSSAHVVFIQTRASTKFINAATGGDCALIGNWNSATKTCTLTTDLTETIQIDGAGITLDGKDPTTSINHTITGTGSGYGVFVPGGNNIVKNLTITNFSAGIVTQPSPSANLRGVYFTDSLTGYAVGAFGRILKTTNAGATWTPQTSGTTATLNSVYFTDSSNGYAVGSFGTIRKTTNAGATWTPQTSGTTASLFSVYFTDPLTGYAVGLGGRILKTTNAGATWTTQTSGTTASLFSVYFTDPLTGYAVGALGKILKTENAGASWTPQTSGTTAQLLSVYFTDLDTGYAVGALGKILKTINAGVNWTAQTSGTTNTLNSVYFTDLNNGYAVGAGGKILKTINGGANWTVQTIGATLNLFSVYFTDPSTGYAVGLDSGSGATTRIILKTTNGGDPTDPTANWTPVFEEQISSGGNTITNNNINSGYGITIDGSLNNNNTITNNTISSIAYGISLGFSSSGNIVNNNIVSGDISNSLGINFESSNNTLNNNTVSNNLVGMYSSSGSSNTLNGNTVQNNEYGIFLDFNASNNILTNNNFINNTIQAVVASSGNIFNLPLPTGGNFWSNWTSPDVNGDGFVDSPFVIDASLGVQDNFPWTTQDGWVTPPSDTTAPSVPGSLTKTTLDNNTMSNFTWLASTDDTGVTSYEVSIDGGVYTDIGNVLTYTLASPQADGAHTFAVKARDAAGNRSAAASVGYTIDTILPTISIQGPSTEDVFGVGSAIVSADIIDAGGVATVSVQLNTNTPVAAAFISGNTWQASVPLKQSDMGTTLNFTVTATDNATNSSQSSVVVDNDGIHSSIDAAPASYSNSFSDGVTFGTIASRGGWTLLITDLASPSGIQASVTGSGSFARITSCNNNVETQLNENNETANILCGSTTVYAFSTLSDVVMKKPPSGGKATVLKLPQGQTGFFGSPVVAPSSNTIPIEIAVVDEFERVLLAGNLAPGQTVDIEPNTLTNEVVINNADPVITFTFTTADNTSIIVPSAAIVEMAITQGLTGEVTQVTYENTSTELITVTSGSTTATLNEGAAVEVAGSTDTFVNVGATSITLVTDGTPATLNPGAELTDQCPGIPGNIGNTGCPFGDKNLVELHTINLGGITSKQLLAGAGVRVFDRNSSQFQTIAGSKNPDGSLYGVVYEANQGRVASCATDATGICYAGETTAGDYLVIVKYVDGDKSVYVGRPKSPSDFVNGLATKDFQIMKVFKKGAFLEYRGGSKSVVTGSQLTVIAPDSSIWEGTSSVYPFIFTSDSDWQVDVCASVPVGYRIVGVYNENGDLVTTDTNCLQVFVAGETKSIAFQVEEVGSPEPGGEFNLTFRHKGKTTKKSFSVSDLRKNTFDQKVAPFQKSKSKVSLWNAAKDKLGANVSSDEIKQLVTTVAKQNSVAIPEWGISGRIDSRALKASAIEALLR